MNGNILVSEVMSAANMLLHGSALIIVEQPLHDEDNGPDDRKPSEALKLIAKLTIHGEECVLVLSRALITGSWSCYTLRYPVPIQSTRFIRNGSPQPWQGPERTIIAKKHEHQKPLPDNVAFSGNDRDYTVVMHRFIEHVSLHRHRTTKATAEASA